MFKNPIFKNNLDFEFRILGLFRLIARQLQRAKRAIYISIFEFQIFKHWPNQQTLNYEKEAAKINSQIYQNGEGPDSSGSFRL